MTLVSGLAFLLKDEEKITAKVETRGNIVFALKARWIIYISCKRSSSKLVLGQDQVKSRNVTNWTRVVMLQIIKWDILFWSQWSPFRLTVRWKLSWLQLSISTPPEHSRANVREHANGNEFRCFFFTFASCLYCQRHSFINMLLHWLDLL